MMQIDLGAHKSQQELDVSPKKNCTPEHLVGVTRLLALGIISRSEQFISNLAGTYLGGLDSYKQLYWASQGESGAF